MSKKENQRDKSKINIKIIDNFITNEIMKIVEELVSLIFIIIEIKNEDQINRKD